MVFFLLIFGSNLIHHDNDRFKINTKKPGNKFFEKNEKKNSLVLLVSVWCTYKLYVLTLSCFGALLHRRHLMVWAVFAPKVSIYIYMYILILMYMYMYI
jgi:hypothetical protein